MRYRLKLFFRAIWGNCFNIVFWIMLFAAVIFIIMGLQGCSTNPISKAWDGFWGVVSSDPPRPPTAGELVTWGLLRTLAMIFSN